MKNNLGRIFPSKVCNNISLHSDDEGIAMTENDLRLQAVDKHYYQDDSR